MPMIRYHVRNEYGLADPELYRAADRDDPEALLEGVAMAGLVGVLRQLGDLAEFAAGIFHELHEEVMATAARGHGLMLRVQQLEAEFPSIEKAFLSRTIHSHFAYNAGIDWHANLRIDQNLVTQGDMPRFILDSYEECRGPPRLFMLDKFDTAGAGACLKRYSDPSFFKTELASSGIMEAKVQREKKARKMKKKASQWRNGEASESSLTPHIDSNLQAEISEHVPEKNPTRRVKLKSRHVNGMDTSSYMESLLEVHSPEQKVLWENSKSRSIKSIDSSESAPKVHEIIIDNSYKYPSFRERNTTQPPSKHKAQLPTNELENQKINGDEFFETLPKSSDEVQNMYSTFQIVEKKEMLITSENKTEGSVDSYRSGEAEKNAIALQEVDQKKFLTEAECITERLTDGYRSDDIGSEVDSYMDALNTMESEIETDSESRAKSDLGLSKIESQWVLSDTNKGQQKLLPQFSEPDFVEDSAAPLRLKDTSNKGMSSLFDSDNLGSLAATQPPQENVISFDVPVDSEICQGETDDKASEELQGNGEVIELDSSVHLLSDGSIAKASDIPNFRPEIGEASSCSCATYLTSTLIHICPQGSFDEAQSITSDSVEISSFYVKSEHKVAEHVDSNLPCMIETSESRQLDGLSLGSRDVPGKTHPAERPEDIISEDMADTVDMPDHISQKQDENTLEKVSAGYVEDVLLRGSKESMEQETEACSSDSLSPTSSALCPGISSIVLQPVDLVADMESVVQPEDLAVGISPGSVRGSHEVTKHLNGSSVGGRDVPEKTHPSKDYEELEDMVDTHYMFDQLPQTQNGIILEKVLVGYVKDSPLSSTVRIEAEPQRSIEQDTEACSGGRISPTSPAISPVIGHIKVQPAGVDAQMENVIASGEELACLPSAEDVEDADDIIKRKIPFPNILPFELERLSDEEPHESCIAESTEFVPFCFGKEAFPNDMQLQSNCEVIDGPLPDNFGFPSGSTVSDLHKDSLHLEKPINYDDSSTKSVSAEIVDYNETSSRYSPELSGFHIQSQEDLVPGDAALNQHKLDIKEASSPTNTTVLHSESTLYMSLSPHDENLPVPTRAVSSSEFSSPDLSYYSDAKLSNGVCLTIPSEDTKTDSHPNIDEESRIYSLESEQDFSSKASPPCTHESAKEDISSSIQPAILDEVASKEQGGDEQNMISSHQEGELLELQPAISDEVASKEQGGDEQNMTSSHQEGELLELQPAISEEVASKEQGGDGQNMISSHQEGELLELQSAISDEIASKEQGGDEQNMIPSHQEGELLEPSDLQFEVARSVEQDNTRNNFVEHDKSSEPRAEQDSRAMSTDGSISELDIPPSKGIDGQLDAEASVPSECSFEHTASSLALNISAAGLPLFAGFELALSESIPQKQSSDPPISDPVHAFQSQDVQEAPPLPPLPPLEWRMGKLRLGSQTSDGNLVQPLTGTNPFPVPSTEDKKHSHGLVTEAEMVQPANLFAPLPALEENRFQRDFLSSENERVQPLMLSELPPIVEDKGYQHGNRGEMVHPLNPSSLVAPIDVDKHLYSHDALWGGMLQPFAPFQSLEDEASQHLHQLSGENFQPSEDKRPQLGELLPSLELEICRHGVPTIERDMVESAGPLLIESAAQDEKYQYNFGVYGGENMQHPSLSAPVPTTGPNMPQPGFVSSWEENPFTPDDGSVPTMEDEKPNGKLRSIRDRPRHPLIDAVAAHDKSKLRKVSDLVQPSTKPKGHERDTLLEHIRKKSFNLKPAAATKPNIKGPPTNLKVAAILEKANAIRQACAGSDEDDDGDSWSDS